MLYEYFYKTKKAYSLINMIKNHFYFDLFNSKYQLNKLIFILGWC